MKAKFPRRDLLKTLGAAAAISSTACRKAESVNTPVPPGVLPRVNLICHGMMLFWQDRTMPTKGITIYAPDAMGMHAVRLSTSLGGLPNLLTMPGTYTLDFTCNNATALGPRDKTKNLAIYDPKPTKGLAVRPAQAQYILNIPYPSAIRPFRTMKFRGRPPYKRTGPHSNTTTAFDINPARMPGAYVLTYNNVSSPVRFAKMGDPLLPIAAPPPLLNIHFYATTDPMITPSPGHLQFFNNLLEYTGQSPIDLEVDNNTPEVIPPQNEVVDGDLTQLDLYDLVELTPMGRAADPVGCIEGWGS